MQKEVYIGIDLGTTNTLVCTDVKGKIKCLRFKNGNGVVLPSVLYYENGEIIVGKKASEDGYLNPNNVIRSSKTDMGSDKVYCIDGMTFTPITVATEILKSVKENVYRQLIKEGYDESTVINAVITVPAYFQGNQYDATKRAAIDAGINVLRIITEPTAAAISYISESANDLEGKKLLVVDIGGGTFDISYLEFDPKSNEYKTIAVDGDKRLGGDDFDECIKEAMVDIVYAETKVDLSSYEKSGLSYKEYCQAIAKLQREARSIKEDLTDSEEASVTIPGLIPYKEKWYNFDIQWTRDEFNDICMSIYQKIFDKIKQFMSENRISADDVWRVALAGGSCSIPYIGQKIEEMFPGKVYSDIDLSTLVVKGAYTVASSSNIVSRDDPVIIRDILSHSLGVKADGIFKEMLPRFSEYPMNFTHTFTTSRDNQDAVLIEVYETRDIGSEDKKNLDNCELLGMFTLSNIRKAKKGEAKIDVTFEYDDSRILRVTAKDQSTGATENIVIEYDKKKIQKKINTTSTTPMQIFLAIDASWSMKGERIESAKKAALNLINNVINLETNSVGVISFGKQSKARLECSLCHNQQLLVKAINSLYYDGGTPLSEALDMVDAELKTKENSYVILLTDGEPNDTDKAFSSAERLKNKGVIVVTVGVELNPSTKKTVEKISSVRSDGTPYLWLTDNVNEISEIFEQILNEISAL